MMLIFCRSQSTPARLAATAGDADADDLNEPLLGRERSAPHRDTSCSAAGTSSAGTQQGGGDWERGKGASVALVLRSVNRIDWAELWSVLCSSVWGASNTLRAKALLVCKLPVAGTQATQRLCSSDAARLSLTGGARAQRLWRAAWRPSCRPACGRSG